MHDLSAVGCRVWNMRHPKEQVRAQLRPEEKAVS